jgi:hypothetical protein
MRSVATQDNLVYTKYISVNPTWYGSLFAWGGLVLLGLCASCFGLSFYSMLYGLVAVNSPAPIETEITKPPKGNLDDVQFALTTFVVIAVFSLVFHIVFDAWSQFLGAIGYIVGFLVGALLILFYLKIKRKVNYAIQ